jgi:hypothetical protein
MTNFRAIVCVSVAVGLAACEPREAHRTPVTEGDAVLGDGSADSPPRNGDLAVDRDSGDGGRVGDGSRGSGDAANLDVVVSADRSDDGAGMDADRSDTAAALDATLVVDARPVADQAPPSADGPGSGCAPGTCKRVFLSSTEMPNGALGSLATSDARCQVLADGRGLGGTWRAWLSDGNASPATRFTRATVPYRLVDGTVVANSFVGLASGTLMHAIDMFETGVTLLPGAQVEVWTGTTTTGASAGATCGNWTNNSAGQPNGSVGVSDRTNGGWTQAYQQFCDRSHIHLYCFEQ